MPDITLPSRLTARAEVAVWAVRALIFAFFLAVEWPCARMTMDDWHYRYVCQGPEYLDFFYSHQPGPEVQTLADVGRSMACHAVNINARVEVHALAQCFISFWGYGALAVAVALLSLIAVELVCRLSLPPDGRPTVALRLGATLIFVAVMPWFDIFGSWMASADYSLCYSLPSVMMLAAFAIFRCLLRSRQRGRWAGILGYGLLGLLIGQLHEGFALPTAAGLTLMLWRAHRRGDAVSSRAWAFWAMLVLGGAWTGALTYSLRTKPFDGHQSAGEYLRWMITDARTVAESLLLVLAVAAAIGIGCLLRRTRGWMRRYVTSAMPYILTGAVSLAINLLIVYKLGLNRAAIPAGVMLWLMLTMLVARRLQRRPPRWLLPLMATALVAIGGWWHTAAATSRQLYDSLLDQYLASTDGTVTVPDFPYIPDRWHYGLPGVPLPLPVNAQGNELFERRHIAASVSGLTVPMEFRPEAQSLAQAQLVYADSTARFYSRPGAWWIAVEGLAELPTEAYAWGGRTTRPIAAVAHMQADIHLSALYLHADTISGRPLLIIGRSPLVHADTLCLKYSDHRLTLHPVCPSVF